jgi:hypothetical protein
VIDQSDLSPGSGIVRKDDEAVQLLKAHGLDDCTVLGNSTDGRLDQSDFQLLRLSCCCFLCRHFYLHVEALCAETRRKKYAFQSLSYKDFEIGDFSDAISQDLRRFNANLVNEK